MARLAIMSLLTMTALIKAKKITLSSSADESDLAPEQPTLEGHVQDMANTADDFFTSSFEVFSEMFEKFFPHENATEDAMAKYSGYEIAHVEKYATLGQPTNETLATDNAARRERDQRQFSEECYMKCMEIADKHVDATKAACTGMLEKMQNATGDTKVATQEAYRMCLYNDHGVAGGCMAQCAESHEL